MTTQKLSDRRTLSVEEAAAELGISRYLAYEQARTGQIAGVPVLRVGRRLLVPRDALERVLAGESSQQEPLDVA